VTQDNYSIRDLVTDLRRITSETTDEHQILSRVRPLARRAALSRHLWLDKKFYAADPEQGFGLHTLHEEPDHSLAVFAVSWLPNRGAPPHNHGTWAVVVGVDGPEKNVFFERTDDGSRPGYAELKKIGEKTFDFGDVLAMPTGGLHSIWNETEATSVSLHIYGKHLNHTGRSQFDPEKKTETPFVVRIES
jgi:predicted metal-dependent enzyme (double-stranded beta helix superfamily)